MTNNCPNCGQPMKVDIPINPPTLEKKIKYLDRIIADFKAGRVSAIARGVIYLIQAERERVREAIIQKTERD